MMAGIYVLCMIIVSCVSMADESLHGEDFESCINIYLPMDYKLYFLRMHAAYLHLFYLNGIK